MNGSSDSRYTSRSHALSSASLHDLPAALLALLVFGVLGTAPSPAAAQQAPSGAQGSDGGEESSAASPSAEETSESNRNEASESSPPPSDPPPEGGRPSPSAERLLEEAGAIAEQVARIRGLAPLRNIEKGVKNREELRDILVDKLAEEQSEEQMRQEAAVFRKLGLIPEGLDYREAILDVLTEQIAGFYDQKKGRLNIMVGIPLDLQRPAMAHEIFHAIQDQHFDLTRMLKPFSGREHGDFQLARSALVEGDATVLMIDYALYREGTLPRDGVRSLVDIRMMANMLKQLDYSQLGALEKLSKGGERSPREAQSSEDSNEARKGPAELFDSSLGSAPAVIRRVLIFPYLAGMRFVISMRSGRTWKEFNEIYRRPPVSTEQILHPKRYAARDEPVILRYDPGPVLDEYERIYDTVLGEFQMRLFLREHVENESKASSDRTIDVARATTGWDGDRLFAFRNDRGRVVLTHLSVWDSSEDAKEYYNALVEVQGRRFPKTATHTADGEHGASTCMHSDSGDRRERVYVERWGDAVLHMEGLPSSLDSDGDETDPTTYMLREQVWESLQRLPFREVYRRRMAEQNNSSSNDTPESK